jgi:hypothetical protein
MPILPIDLQTLFAQMNQVGKDQSVQKDGTAIQNAMQGMGLVKENEQKDNSVNQSRDVGDDIEKLKNESRNKRERKNKKKAKQEQEEKKKKYFTDPDLGHHIDISS